ncbi:MAG: hypothetical protein EOP04_08960 [Proteobacteria bacterium]|nr:MAG: hypothetical protein EOP04_08960 [Pseudomonadota bacterium]
MNRIIPILVTFFLSFNAFAKEVKDSKLESKMEGYTLTRIKKDSMYEKAGFLDGDVIREINGVKLDSVPVALKAFDEIQNSQAPIKFLVFRNGRLFTLEIVFAS